MFTITVIVNKYYFAKPLVLPLQIFAITVFATTFQKTAARIAASERTWRLPSSPIVGRMCVCVVVDDDDGDDDDVDDDDDDDGDDDGEEEEKEEEEREEEEEEEEGGGAT